MGRGGEHWPSVQAHGMTWCVMTEEALTVPEVAKRLRVSPTTIGRMLRDGRLPAVKFGGQWRITSATIDRVLRGEIRVEIERHPKIVK